MSNFDKILNNSKDQTVKSPKIRGKLLRIGYLLSYSIVISAIFLLSLTLGRFKHIPMEASLEQLRHICPTHFNSNSEMKFALRIVEAVEQASQDYDVEPELVFSVIATESSCNYQARSSKGAKGLMQLMPTTANWLGVSNPYSIEDNIGGGAKYLSQLIKQFDGDYKLALAAYNAGPSTVKKYRNQIPPYRETKDYVKKVMKRYSRLKKRRYLSVFKT